MAKYYGSDYSLAHLRELAKTNKEGTTALGLVEAAKKIGFETRAIKAEMSLFEMEDVPYPFIAHVNKDGKLQHYYVIYKSTKRLAKTILAIKDLCLKIKGRKSQSPFFLSLCGL